MGRITQAVKDNADEISRMSTGGKIGVAALLFLFFTPWGERVIKGALSGISREFSKKK